MNELLVKDNSKIEDMIYEIRGKQVMLSSDVATLYEEETRRINEVVKRNVDRFPDDFCFQLTKNEWNSLKSQFAISREVHGGTRYLPYVFTEYGIMMLSGLLKSNIAAQVNKLIIKAFVNMKKYIVENNYNEKLSNVETKLIEHDNKINLIINQISSTTKVNHIFFEGQIYDAYSKIIDIFKDAKKEIIIIDNYLDKNMLDIISKAKVSVILVTADKLDNIDFTKYKKQYNNLNVIINKGFHDRFIILDKSIVYHLGASLNTLGKKCFAITKMEEKDIINQLLNKI